MKIFTFVLAILSAFAAALVVHLVTAIPFLPLIPIAIVATIMFALAVIQEAASKKKVALFKPKLLSFILINIFIFYWFLFMTEVGIGMASCCTETPAAPTLEAILSFPISFGLLSIRPWQVILNPFLWGLFAYFFAIFGTQLLQKRRRLSD